MLVDLTAAARRADPERARQWLGEQLIFISSRMADTAAERDAVDAAVAEDGARPLRFEEFGRDAEPREAYLVEVDSCTIYLGILREEYGPILPAGFSATEVEYMRARERGKRVVFYIAGNVSRREDSLNRFIKRVRAFNVTETFSDVADLKRRVRRRLQELAAEALTPWVKLGDVVFRADLIEDSGATVTVTARTGDDVGHVLDDLGTRQFGQPRLRLAYEERVTSGELGASNGWFEQEEAQSG